jgi:hypothetical protein
MSPCRINTRGASWWNCRAPFASRASPRAGACRVAVTPLSVGRKFGAGIGRVGLPSLIGQGSPRSRLPFLKETRWRRRRPRSHRQGKCAIRHRRGTDSACPVRCRVSHLPEVQRFGATTNPPGDSTRFALPQWTTPSHASGGTTWLRPWEAAFLELERRTDELFEELIYRPWAITARRLAAAAGPPRAGVRGDPETVAAATSRRTGLIRRGLLSMK